MKGKTEEEFLKVVNDGYSCRGDYVTYGAAVLDGKVVKEALVNIPLATLNRHGLVAGATGTGKTKSLQKLAELLSEKGVPSLVMDIKGDFSGVSQEGDYNDKVKSREEATGIKWSAESYPTEFMSLSDDGAIRMRSTVSEFGPVLFSKMLELNDTQSSVVSLVFKYCDDKGLPLLDLADFRKVLQYIQTDEGKDDIEKDFGTVAGTSIGTIMRKVIELEEQGGEMIFGEPSFEVNDLVATRDGMGVINVIRLMNVQTKPKLFSTFMLSLLAEMYQKFPELGDVQKPKLVVFIDEAHLLFEEASKDLLNQIEQIVKLIRSKGVGIIFCTQNPIDIPDDVLAQLGLKVQHALRAFTAKDRDAIKKASENYPETDFYQVDKLITELGIGEAFVTALSEKGTPTPLVHCMNSGPRSRMSTITDDEYKKVLSESNLLQKYNQNINRDSAYEMLCKKMDDCEEGKALEEEAKREAKSTGSSAVDTIMEISKNPLVRDVARTATRAAMRGILGMLTKRK